jgi:hypothetical protein
VLNSTARHPHDHAANDRGGLMAVAEEVPELAELDLNPILVSLAH